MRSNKDTIISAQQEVNLKLFLHKVFINKKLFLISIGMALLLAVLYIAMTTPEYEVSTSILIDPSGSNRMLGESQYVEGGVGLIEMEKNLYNEIGIIKSFSLINQTVEDLGLDVTYYAGSWPKKREQYGYFPFKVALQRDMPQLFNVPFKVEILSNRKYKLTLDASNFEVSNPRNGTTHEVQRSIQFSQEYAFGEEVINEYFNFILDTPNYSTNTDDFKGEELSFVIHSSEDITKGLMGDLEVDNIDIQASIFRIVSEGTIVAKEVAFLNKLTENYINNKLNARNDIATTKESFIRNQLAIITDSLLNSELSLEGFKKGGNVIDLSATATSAMNRTQRLQMSIAKLRLDIQYYNDMIQYVDSCQLNDLFRWKQERGSTGCTNRSITRSFQQPPYSLEP